MRCTGERLVDDVTYLDVAGATGFGDVDDNITNTVASLTRRGRRAFVLNMEKVSSLNSYELGDLAGSRRAAGQVGATLALTNVRPRVAEVLRIMNLSKVFGLADPASAG